MTVLPPLTSPNASRFDKERGSDYEASIYRPSGGGDFPADDAEMPSSPRQTSATSASSPAESAKPDTSVEEAFWEVAHLDQPYAGEDDYERFAAAYRIGYEGYERLAPEYAFGDVEEELQEEFEEEGTSLSWDRAREATRAAWDRMEVRYHDAAMAAGEIAR